MVSNLVKMVLQRGGRIRPLIIPPELTEGTGLCNPTVFIDNGRILVNIRHVQYNLYMSEFGQKFESRWGPMTYMHPEDDPYLRTTNFISELNEDLVQTNVTKVDTTALDKPPIWDFVGLEDGRLVRWDGKLYLTGVRRDTTPNGEGRMEFSELKEVNGEVKEISRVRVQPPNDPTSYCEKNWMPIIDMPYHMVKWTNPTEIVKVDLETGTSKTVAMGPRNVEGIRDLRGGSQVVPWGEYRIAVTHEVDLFSNEPGNKDCHYYHRIVVWDKDWNIVKTSTDFKFMDGRVEFTCGLAEHNGNLLVTFGYHDNAAFILEIPNQVIEEFLDGHPATESN